MQKRRWRPSLMDVVMRCTRKHMPAILANITRNNALFLRLQQKGE